MSDPHKLASSPAPVRRSTLLPWAAVGGGAMLVLGGLFIWGFAHSEQSEQVRSDDPAMRRLLEESRAIEQEFAQLAENRTPTTAELQRLQRAVDNQREWMRLSGGADAEQERRLKNLEALYDDALQRSQLERSQEAERAARELLAAGANERGLAKLREAWTLQQQLDQRPGVGRGRDLARETGLAQEIDRRAAEPVQAELVAVTAEATRRRDARQPAEALVAYHRAHELQLRLNREFGRTAYANLVNLEALEIEIATLESAALFDELMTVTAQAADAQGRADSEGAVALFERAVAVQQKLNGEFPRSRYASTERLDTLEVARQTEATTKAAQRVADLDRAIATKLRAHDLAGVAEMLIEGAGLQDAMFARLPRSRRLDPELRLKFNYLVLQREALAGVAQLVETELRPLPGRPGRLLRGEVSQRLYEQVARSNPSRLTGGELPVESVSAADAADFCRRLSWMLGRPVRLPTEAEYRAALGAVPTGAALAAHTWAQERSGQTIHPVNTSAANAAGFCDLLGNVAEWLAPDRSEPELALVAGGSYADPEAELATVPLTKHTRLDRARTIGFRVVVE